jgi:hypothetical protein
MTLRYAHLSPEHKAKAVELLDKTQQKRTAQWKHKWADPERPTHFKQEWSWRGSNPRPLECHSSTLPAAPQPQF